MILTCAILGPIGLSATIAKAHGFVGNFFFPATIITDDPLVTNEFALLFSGIPGSGDKADQDLGISFEFSKLIFPKLAIGVSNDYAWQKPTGARTNHGWDNLTLSLKYEVWRSDEHAAILSVGLESEIGGTGSRSIGRNSFSTFTPTVYFGKGFSDLPDSLEFFKPVAVTGTLGLTLPTEAADPNSLEWGFALEYNIPYLQQHVKDLGLPEPFKNMIPLVEFAGESPLNRGGGTSTMTINPGVLWESKYFQVGIEALIPMNHESGTHIGGIIQVQFYIDDLMPKLFGGSIFGE